jgi:hypothetical protein
LASSILADGWNAVKRPPQRVCRISGAVYLGFSFRPLPDGCTLVPAKSGIQA